MKTLYNLELMRHGVTPAQFLAYCRSQCKKHGISWGMDTRYFADGEKHSFGYLDSHYDGGTPSTRPAAAETCKSLPYDHQTYIRNFDGSVYNEIVEFNFDDERTGTGYFYIVSTESDTAEDTEKEAQSIARYHARQIERNARQIEKDRTSITETESNAAHGWTDQQWAAGHIETLRREIKSLEHENAEHAAAIAEMTADNGAAIAEMTADNGAAIAEMTADNGAEKKGESTMTTTEKIIAYFRENEDTFCECIEQLDSWNGYLGDDRYYMMEELDDLYYDTPASELLARAYYGHDEDSYTVDQYDQRHYDAFNPNRDFFRYNGYGNLVSTDYKDYSDHLDRYAINEMADHRNNIAAIDDNPVLSELFDELEAEKETA